MQKLLVSCGFFLSLVAFGGCVATTPGLGEEAGNAALPSGLTLLDSDEGECDGMVQVGDETLEGGGDGLDGDFFVEPGENATFELETGREEVEWACLGEGGGSPGVERTSCPDGATHVRITRATTGGELLVECYG